MITVWMFISLIAVGLADNVIVRTTTGLVRGYEAVSTRDGTSYVGFVGIPYSAPPIGDLRFKVLQPHPEWNITRNATEKPAKCFWTAATPANRSSEDCLFMNVFVPNFTQAHILKPVMVFIHGGAFFEGSTDVTDIAPDFYMDKGVIYASFSYRLGPLGFLSLHNKDLPGNLGLKDQVFALRWLRENIARFGGDPDQVTIFGQSAGGASVNFIQLNNSTRGLYRRTIHQSGEALSAWAYVDPGAAVDRAYRLGHVLNCGIYDRSARGKKKLFECFCKASAEDLSYKQLSVVTEEENERFVNFPFIPTLEPDIQGAFLTRPPIEILKSGNFVSVPAMIGQVEREGLLYLRWLNQKDPNGTWTEKVGLNMTNFIPADLLHDLNQTEAEDIGQLIRNFYFDGENITLERRQQLIDIRTDTHFTIDIQRLVYLMAQKNKDTVYNYLFSYDGPFNYWRLSPENNGIKGPAHTDDLGYLMNSWYLHPTYDAYSRNSTPHRVIDRMITMWTNFAKTGNPTPSTDKEIITTKWEPFTLKQYNYLDIGESLTLKKGFAENRMRFWNDIYDRVQHQRPLPQQRSIVVTIN